jgi:hypothetical protein
MELTPFAQDLALPVKELLHQVRTLVELGPVSILRSTAAVSGC